jgi:Rrf2 family cysteine metabolism transcriptional repressor
MLELAMNYTKRPILLRDIARKEDISEGYLQHIVDALKGSGLVLSNRIGHGGYTLARKPKEITLRDILSSLEGSISLSECVSNPDICERSTHCTTRDVWVELCDKFSRSLDDISLNDMIERRMSKNCNNILYEI